MLCGFQKRGVCLERLCRLSGLLCCSALQCVAVRCSALQCVAVCCSVLQCEYLCQQSGALFFVEVCNKANHLVLQCVAVRCGVLQCVAVHCSALQCVAVCCSFFVEGCNKAVPPQLISVYYTFSCLILVCYTLLPIKNTPQNTATNCDTLRHSATHCCT